MTGFIALHRKVFDNPLLQDGDRFRAWFWLVANACWKPTRTRIKGDTVELQRGELSFSQRFLADKWGWSKSRVDRFIADLRDEGMIETRSKIGADCGATAGHKAGQGQSIISICNYDEYQDIGLPQRGNDTPESGATTGASAGQQRGKEEQGNNNTEEEERAREPEIPTSPTLLPADFEPRLGPRTKAMVERWPDGMFDRQVIAFEAHARTNARTQLDWQAALQTWLTKADKRLEQELRDEQRRSHEAGTGNTMLDAVVERQRRRTAQK